MYSTPTKNTIQPAQARRVGRPPKPIENTKYYAIYQEIRDYCQTTNTIPPRHSLWQFVVKPKFGISWKTFCSHWEALEAKGMVRTHKTTGAILFKDAEIYIPIDL